jgi:formate dehydrogenase subunit delta
MSASTLSGLRYMANQIAQNLTAMNGDRAVLATADHINKFWAPRMKERIFTDIQGEEGRAALSPVALAAFEHLAAGANPKSQTRATEFNGVDEVGHSDGG